MNKLILILAAALLLGGCTIGSNLMGNNATDSASYTPTPTSSAAPDPDLEAMPQTTSSSDESSIQTDLESTVILEEDFSDLE